MDIGGDPERDESGLPPVDIEIPDDARELDRDVHAYYREMRAQRRRRRAERLTAPFTKHGMVVPLVAGMLALTLFAGTMLTVITSAPETTGLPRPIQSVSPRSTPLPGKMGGPLPQAAVLVGNKPAQLRDLPAPSVLAVVPRGCGCLTALRQLAAQAAQMQVLIYFVAAAGGGNQLAKLARRVAGKQAQVVEDSQNTLRVYKPVGLTAILVHSDFAVTEVDRRLVPGFHLEAKLQGLGSPALGYTGSPSPGSPSPGSASPGSASPGSASPGSASPGSASPSSPLPS